MGVPSPPFWTIVINTFGKNNLSKINSYFYSFQFFGEMIIPLIFAFIISILIKFHYKKFSTTTGKFLSCPNKSKII